MSSISAGTTTTTGYVVSSDTTGALVLKTGASGTTALTIGSDQSVTFVGSQTLSGGTANGVLYLNGSKVATSGSALVFDGSNLGVGTSSPASDARLTLASPNTESYVMFSRTNSGVFDVAIGNSGGSIVFRGGADSATVAGLTEFMRLDSVGNLGLGVTPSTLDTGKTIQVGFNSNTIWGATANNFQFLAGATYNNAYLYAVTGSAVSNYRQNAGQHQWYNAPSGTAGNAITFTQAMTLDASGRLGIGTTNPDSKLVVEGGSGTYAQIKDGTVNTFVQARSADSVGAVGTITNHGLAFFTSSSERARIDPNGPLLINRTTYPSGITSGCRLMVNGVNGEWATAIENPGASIPYGLFIRYTAAAPNSSGTPFVYAADNTTARFFVPSNGGIHNYQANNVNLSDRREKTNFAPAKSYLDVICSIPVQTFNYIDQNLEEDGGLTLGVVAQDVQAVAPELVHESDWGTKEEPKMRLSIYQTDLQYALMKCIQEQQALIESLTQRIAALEGTS